MIELRISCDKALLDGILACDEVTHIQTYDSQGTTVEYRAKDSLLWAFHAEGCEVRYNGLTLLTLPSLAEAERAAQTLSSEMHSVLIDNKAAREKASKTAERFLLPDESLARTLDWSRGSASEQMSGEDPENLSIPARKSGGRPRKWANETERKREYRRRKRLGIGIDVPGL